VGVAVRIVLADAVVVLAARRRAVVRPRGIAIVSVRIARDLWTGQVPGQLGGVGGVCGFVVEPAGRG
jgi:hypothetical protein